MKFLCSNCKAKYQIADEKVAGRTLRMTCRRCREEIVIHGTAELATHSSYPAPTSSQGGRAPQPSASALGADFQQQVAGHARAPAPIAPVIDEWHVGINDVPVGPMRRDEVARKLAAGAIHADSLAWREGLDDWLPIRHIPELAALCAPPAAMGIAPLAPHQGYPMAPPPPAAYGAPSALGAPIYGGVPAPPPAAMYAQPPQVLLQQPGQRADMIPIGGRTGAGPGYGMEDWAPVADPHSQSRAARNPLLDPPPDERRGSVLPSMQVFALASAMALAMSAVMILGVRFLRDQNATAPAGAAHNATPSVANAPVPAVAPSAANEAPSGSANSVVALEDPNLGARPGTPARPTQAGRTGPATTASKPKKELTDAQKQMLARMGGNEASSLANLQPTSVGATGSGPKPSGGLKADQLSKVVVRGRENLQRCYETALRGSGSTDTVRMDVEVTVSAAGNVTSAKANGQGLPGMAQCIERTVKMWRFPESGETTQTKFPVVFQPGS